MSFRNDVLVCPTCGKVVKPVGAGVVLCEVCDRMFDEREAVVSEAYMPQDDDGKQISFFEGAVDG